jgi:peroxiredoxin
VARADNLHELPPNLPVPQDDGACDHLPGILVPAIPLRGTAGGEVVLANLPGRVVVYCYPRTGRPDEPSPAGWNEIPGARGCTPQSCSFRDHFTELKSSNAEVFGLSTQSTEDQQEAAARLHLPFELLSDYGLRFARALKLPTFNVEGMELIKRLTLILSDGRIEKVFYPVFPPDRNAGDVLDWLKSDRKSE